MYLKFVNRATEHPSETLKVECDSYQLEQKWVRVGEHPEKHCPSIGRTYWPFENRYPRGVVEEDTQVLIIDLFGTPHFDIIMVRDTVMFETNDQGETIDKVVV
jgi:hypothetical protein